MSYSYDDNGLRPENGVTVYSSGGGGQALIAFIGVALVIALIVAVAVGIRSFGPEAKARAEVIARTPVPTPTPAPVVVESRNKTELNYQAGLRTAMWVGLSCLGSLLAVWVYAVSVKNVKSSSQQPVKRLSRTDPSLIGWDEIYDPVGGGVTYLEAGEKEPHIEHAQLVAENFSAAAAWSRIVAELTRKPQLTGPELQTLERGMIRLEQLGSGE